MLGEFFVNVTRKPRNPLTPDQASTSCHRLSRSWVIFGLTPHTHLRATEGVRQHSLSYWDSLLWATAVENEVPCILTEDQQHRRLVESVRYLDPFATDFDLGMLS